MRLFKTQRIIPIAKSLQALSLVGFAWLAASANAQSQTAGYAETDGPTTGPGTAEPFVTPVWWSQVRPAVPFTYNSSAQLGSVTIPIPGTYGWTVLKSEGVEIRTVPSMTGDPTFEAIILPPFSGHPLRTERITIQVPLSGENIPGSGALVVGFHSYSVSEKQIFGGTDLPAICAQKGWTLLAPYGLVDTHFGNEQSQKSLDAMLELIDEFLNFDRRRIYTVGFSMGGGAAMSYAMRRRSEDKYRVAGVVNHTGTMDLLDEYNSGSASFKTMMENAAHFYNPPVSETSSFPYERCSPAIFSGGAIDLLKMPARNLNNLAIYTYVNPGDPQTKLVSDNTKVAGQMLSEGVNINYVSSLSGVKHHWDTMDMHSAMDWISRFRLPNDPLEAAVYADRLGEYHYADVRAAQANRIATFNIGVKVGSNKATLRNTRFVDEIALDTVRMGLSSTIPYNLEWSSSDAGSDDVILQAFRMAPTSVHFDGALATTWSHDAVTQELTITTPAGPSGAVTTILVTP
ncbi:MAG: pimeloyl-ACP methyl ester carboxylesterase [Bacteroidia bacterium]|jgi:pimeloyl-ACP methyl ester carboxylesterase